MNKTLIAASLALGLGALAMLGLRPGGEEGPPPVSIGMACVNPVAGCATRIGDHAVSFGAQGRPEPLKPFQLWVNAPGARSVVASFTMPDMNMGLNVYTLRADGDGVFSDTVHEFSLLTLFCFLAFCKVLMRWPESGSRWPSSSERRALWRRRATKPNKPARNVP